MSDQSTVDHKAAIEDLERQLATDAPRQPAPRARRAGLPPGAGLCRVAGGQPRREPAPGPGLLRRGRRHLRPPVRAGAARPGPQRRRRRPPRPGRPAQGRRPLREGRRPLRRGRHRERAGGGLQQPRPVPDGDGPGRGRRRGVQRRHRAVRQLHRRGQAGDHVHPPQPGPGPHQPGHRGGARSGAGRLRGGPGHDRPRGEPAPLRDGRAQRRGDVQRPGQGERGWAVVVPEGGHPGVQQLPAGLHPHRLPLLLRPGEAQPGAGL